MKTIALLIASVTLMVSAANSTVFSVTGTLQNSWSVSSLGSVDKTFSILPVINGTYDDQLNQLNIAWQPYALHVTVTMLGSADMTYDARMGTTYGAGARMIENKGLASCIGPGMICSSIPQVAARLESMTWNSSGFAGTFLLSEDIPVSGLLFESYTFYAQAVFNQPVSLYVSDVPVPAAGWMLGVALISLAGIKFKRDAGVGLE
jgi:hypothetical protein